MSKAKTVYILLINLASLFLTGMAVKGAIKKLKKDPNGKDHRLLSNVDQAVMLDELYGTGQGFEIRFKGMRHKYLLDTMQLISQATHTFSPEIRGFIMELILMGNYKADFAEDITPLVDELHATRNPQDYDRLMDIVRKKVAVNMVLSSEVVRFAHYKERAVLVIPTKPLSFGLGGAHVILKGNLYNKRLKVPEITVADMDGHDLPLPMHLERAKALNCPLIIPVGPRKPSTRTKKVIVPLHQSPQTPQKVHA